MGTRLVGFGLLTTCVAVGVAGFLAAIGFEIAAAKIAIGACFLLAGMFGGGVIGSWGGVGVGDVD